MAKEPAPPGPSRASAARRLAFLVAASFVAILIALLWG